MKVDARVDNLVEGSCPCQDSFYDKAEMDKISAVEMVLGDGDPVCHMPQSMSTVRDRKVCSKICRGSMYNQEGLSKVVGNEEKDRGGRRARS